MKTGDKVTWLQTRKWGGKQCQPATFISFTGKASAVIEVHGKRHTVKVVSIRQEAQL